MDTDYTVWQLNLIFGARGFFLRRETIKRVQTVLPLENKTGLMVVELCSDG